LRLSERRTGIERLPGLDCHWHQIEHEMGLSHVHGASLATMTGHEPRNRRSDNDLDSAAQWHAYR
jgi:hypothetical protein